MRARTNISLKPRYTATLGDFKGVDLNASPLRVAQNRAASMKNFICDSGINHKRPGWEEMLRVLDADGNALAIHGLFPFDEGGTEVLLLHAGTGIYRAAKTGGEWAIRRLDGGSLGITEARSQCFYRGGRAFIVGCGNFLVYGEFDGSYALKEVAEIAYVPTTTIAISAGGADGDLRASLDAVNLLTRRRRNTCLFENSDTYYELDGKIALGETVTVEIDGMLSLGYSARLVLEGKAERGVALAYRNENPLTVVESTFPESFGYLPGAVVGYVANITDLDTPRDSIQINNMPFLEGTEMTVTYTAALEGYDARRIPDCRFGATFGANGADDRLFLAGNGAYKNTDFWSEWNDFTYFPDGNRMEVGSANAAIRAYARLSDTTLAVLKEEKAGEPTIFYRTGAERTEADGVTLTQWFPVSAGIAGDGAVNPHAVATLSGDVLTLTREGVHALVLSANVASGERYTRERSRPIYRELADADLSTAAATVYRNRYYLALPDTGKCYVADAHYKATFEGSTDFNYEWWVWENVPAACFAEYKDQLIFGTSEGRVCAFTEGVFTDRTYTALENGDMTPSTKRVGAVTYNINTPPDGYDRVMLKGNVYALIDGTPESLDGKELYVAEVNTEEQWFTVARDRELQQLLQLCTDSETSDWTGRFVHVTPVEAEWITPIMDLGTNDKSKSLVQLTVATEPGINGSVTFGYETRRILRQMQAERAYAVSAERSAVEIGKERGFSFDDLDFNSFSFDTAFAHSYTKRVCLRNFNFIQFRFGSDTDEDCAVSGVTLVYKVNQNNRGVR